MDFWLGFGAGIMLYLTVSAVIDFIRIWHNDKYVRRDGS